MQEKQSIHSPSTFARNHLMYPLLAGFFASDNLFFFERKYYPAYEYLEITSGKGSFKHGQTWMQVGKGDVLLHNMRYPHAYQADPADPFQMKYIVFDGMIVESVWKTFTLDYFVFLPPTQKKSDALYTIDEFYSQVSQNSLNEIYTSSILYKLLLQILSNSTNILMQTEPTKHAAIEKSKQYIEEQYLTIGSIQEISDKINLSLFHFTREFKKHYGCTPKEYLLIQRINHAKRLLLLSNHNITEVAFESGFQSYNTFLQVFLKMELCSPSKYRKSWKMRL